MKPWYAVGDCHALSSPHQDELVYLRHHMAPKTTSRSQGSELSNASKKLVFKWGGGSGQCGPKTHWGVLLLDKVMILQGVKPTNQPLGIGYANRPKKAQNGCVWRFCTHTGMPSLDLTTSAR